MICSERELGIGDDHDGILVLTRSSRTTRTRSRASSRHRRHRRCSASTARPSRSTSRPTAATASRCAASRASTRTPPAPRSPTRRWRWRSRAAGRPTAASRSSCATTPRSAAAPAATATSPASCAASTSPRPPRGGWRCASPRPGMRPISLPVDITNYVMLGLGQPLHAYDLDTSRARSSCAARAPGERLTTLDDVDRALHPGDLLITDRGERPSASPVSWAAPAPRSAPTTRNVLIEAAHFDPGHHRPHGPPAQAAVRGVAALRARRRPGARRRGGPLRRRPPRRARRRSRRPGVTDVGTPAEPAPVDHARRLPVEDRRHRLPRQRGRRRSWRPSAAGHP